MKKSTKKIYQPGKTREFFFFIYLKIIGEKFKKIILKKFEKNK